MGGRSKGRGESTGGGTQNVSLSGQSKRQPIAGEQNRDATIRRQEVGADRNAQELSPEIQEQRKRQPIFQTEGGTEGDSIAYGNIKQNKRQSIFGN